MLNEEKKRKEFEIHTLLIKLTELECVSTMNTNERDEKHQQHL